MKLDIIGVGFDKFGERFMQLEDDTRVYIDSAEYNSMKQKLSGKKLNDIMTWIRKRWRNESNKQ